MSPKRVYDDISETYYLLKTYFGLMSPMLTLCKMDLVY